MRDHYDVSKLKPRRNPYPQLLKQSVTIRLDRDTVDYFKRLADKTGLPYQNLINLFLRDCAVRQKEPALTWSAVSRQTARAARRPTKRSASRR